LKKKNLEFRFLFSLAAAFLEQSAGLRGEAVPEISASRDVEDHGSVRSRAWAVDGGLLGRLERKLPGFRQRPCGHAM
jgi:hypothetical protein